MKDCIHQIRLWNTRYPIYIILDKCHTTDFWLNLVKIYEVKLVYTDTLTSTTHHTYFTNNFKGDTFRKGYWKYVKERFFYIEELMARESLEHVLSFEYDVLIYMNIEPIIEKFKASHQTLRFVRDNDVKGHPACIYIPNSNCIQHFNMFLVQTLGDSIDDMEALAYYANTYNNVHYLPVLTQEKNSLVKNRKSLVGHISKNPYYLSEDSEYFGILFDSLVVGQWISGIDSRNIGGQKISNYENESALYSIKEMNLKWEKENFLWKPILDSRPLFMIHMHSKALSSFRSDRPDCPKDDYDVKSLHESLLPN